MGKNGFNAESHLLKHGWTKGAGLGSKEDGIKEAIKVKLKFDQSGVGHNPGDEFTFNWWDHAFNKAASKIRVNTTQDGVQIESNTSLEDSISTKKTVIPDKKKMLYGTFIKSSAGTSEGEIKRDQFKDSGLSSDSGSDSDVEQPDIGSLSKLTDEQLIKICEGRTAHKGARHGLMLSGKLARIAAQENQYKASATAVIALPSTQQHVAVGSAMAISYDRQSRTECIKDKCRKVKRDHSITSNNNSSMQQKFENDAVIKKSKKKSKHKVQEMDNSTNVGSEFDSTLVKNKKKKKKRSKCIEVDSHSAMEHNGCPSELKSPKKKKSTINKHSNDESVKEESFTKKRQIKSGTDENLHKHKKSRSRKVD